MIEPGHEPGCAFASDGVSANGCPLCNPSRANLTWEPEYDKKTNVEERAAAYSRTVKYLGGEVQLAMQAAVMSAYIEGYRDRKGEEPK